MTQTTISTSIHCSGIGLHSGKPVSLTMHPASVDTGIVFHIRTSSGTKTIKPQPEAVTATQLATTLGAGDAQISTVEHLLAALRGLEVDNIIIEANDGELPIMDGSARTFVSQIQQAGIRPQQKPRKVLRITAPLTVTEGIASIQALPYEGFHVDYTIKFPHPEIGEQRLSIDINPTSFMQIADCRTFGFLQQIEALRTQGRALGGSLENAIVLNEKEVINPEGLRHKDEFVRHKILDFVGDMAMLPLPLQGKFIISCSGHGLNNNLLRNLTARQNSHLETVTLAGSKQRTDKRFLHNVLHPTHAAAAIA